MLRNVAGIVAGLVAWVLIVTVLNFGLRLWLPGYVEAEPGMDFTLAMKIARLAILFWIDQEFCDEIILSLSEVKLVNEKIATVRILAFFTNQKRIEESGSGDGKQFALPPVLLVNDQVKIIEVASGLDGLLPGFFWQDSVKSCG